MPKLNLKPNHKAIRDYYTTLQHYKQHTITQPRYIVDLIGRVIYVSLRTVEIVVNLPELCARNAQ